MDLEAQNSEAQDRFRSALAKLLAIRPEDLVRTEELGTSLDFRDGIPAFARTLSLFRELAEADLDDVPASLLNNIGEHVEAALEDLKAILRFNPSEHSNPGAERDRLIQAIASNYGNRFTLISPVIAYARLKRTASIWSEEGTRKVLDRVGELEKEMRSVQQSMAARAGVTHHASRFAEEADRHDKARWWWLGATGIFFALLLFYSIWILCGNATTVSATSTEQLIQAAIARVLLFSVLSSGLVWTARMYRAASHNWVVNRHRQHALSTFETFATAASDDQTKNAVLLQATQSIFSHQPSGFAPGEKEATASPQVLEIIRNATGRSES